MSRWWAPAGAHLGPDDTDLSLLEPGTDRRLDLGQYLLAVHRMGAAACEEVASGPVPDEFSFVETIAKARSIFARPVVDAVSKSLEDPSYADLLVRDVVDDAEQGALQVFRTAVRGGVPAAIAAQRAGMVYGVPPDEVGPFLAVAKELRAHPAALQEAADKVLFTAIEKIVTEEIEAIPAKWEEVSKAPAVLERTTVTPDLADTPYFDARDAGGRFTAEAPRVSLAQLLEQAKQQAPAPLEKPQRVQRIQRIKRIQRVPQQVESATQAAPKQATSQAISQAVNQLTAQQFQQVVREAVSTAADDKQGWPDDLLEKLPGGEFDRLNDTDEMTLVLSGNAYRELLKRIGDGDDRFFRIGHLVNKAGAPVSGADQLENRRGEVADLVREFNHDEAPIAEIIPKRDLDLTEAMGGSKESLAQEKAWEMAEDYVDRVLRLPEGVKRDARIRVEAEAIYRIPYYNRKGDRVLIHQTEDSRNADLVELVIPAHAYDVRGAHGPNSGPGEIELDPNQVFKVVAMEPDPDYDPGAFAAIRRYAILPMADDEQEERGISKAAAVLDRPDTKYYDARDVKGRFTAAPVSLTERLNQKTAAPTKINRVQRVSRVQRAKETTSAPAQQQTRQASKQVARQQVAQRIQQATQQSLKTVTVPESDRGPGHYELDAGWHYTVMREDKLADLLSRQTPNTPLDPKIVSALLAKVTSGEMVHGDLHDQHEEMDLEEPEWEDVAAPFPAMLLREYEETDPDNPYSIEVDENAVTVNIRNMRLLAGQYFELNPKAQSVRLLKGAENEPIKLQRDLRDLTDFRALPPLVVVDIAEDFDKTKPAVLIPGVQTRKTRFIPPDKQEELTWGEAHSPEFDFQGVEGPAALEQNTAISRNPRVRVYRLVNE